jgi:hypothetical protein
VKQYSVQRLDLWWRSTCKQAESSSLQDAACHGSAAVGKLSPADSSRIISNHARGCCRITDHFKTISKPRTLDVSPTSCIISRPWPTDGYVEEVPGSNCLRALESALAQTCNTKVRSRRHRRVIYHTSEESSSLLQQRKAASSSKASSLAASSTSRSIAP